MIEDSPEAFLKNRIANLALELRAVNVDEADRPAVNEAIDSFEKAAEADDADKLMMNFVMAHMATALNPALPNIIKLTLGRVVSEMTIEMIAKVQNELG